MKARNISYQASKRVLIALTLTALLTGCGAADDSVDGAGGATTVAPVNQCIPITTQIPFSFSGGSYAYRKIVVGAVPGVQTAFGSVIVGGAAATGQLAGSGINGFISLQVVPVDGVAPQTLSNSALGYFPVNNAANPVGINGTGIIQINARTQSDMANKVALGAIQVPGLTGTTNTGATSLPTLNGGYLPLVQQSLLPVESVCVSSVAVNMDIAIDTNELYMGEVYLYLNNTTQGYKMRF